MHIFFALRGQNMQNSILVNTLIDFEQSILPNKHYKYNLTRVPQGTGFFEIHNLSINNDIEMRSGVTKNALSIEIMFTKY